MREPLLLTWPTQAVSRVLVKTPCRHKYRNQDRTAANRRATVVRAYPRSCNQAR